MRQEIKSLYNILEERELVLIAINPNYLYDHVPVMLADTGAIIDIQKCFRTNNIGKKYKEPPFSNIYQFFNHLNYPTKLLVPPKVGEEINKHGNMKLNQYVCEIPQHVIKLVNDDLLPRFKEFYSQIIIPTEVKDHLDDLRYAVHWTAIEACKGDAKKSSECMSEADKELLLYSLILSKSTTKDQKKISPIFVLSSDKHLVDGINFLNREEGYENLHTISTRHKEIKF